MRYIPSASLSNLLPQLPCFWLASWTLFYACAEAPSAAATKQLPSLTPSPQSSAFTCRAAASKRSVHQVCGRESQDKPGHTAQPRVGSFTDPTHAARASAKHRKLEWPSGAVWRGKTIHDFKSVLKHSFESTGRARKENSAGKARSGTR